MTATLIPNADDLRIAEQLAMAKAMRERGMTGTGGSGMAGQVYMVGNQWGNLAENIGGAILGAKAASDRDQLQAARDQQKQAWLAQMPSTTETLDIQQATPEQQFGPTQAPAVPTEVQKSPRALAQATQAWAMQAPHGMESIQNFALQQAMTAPQRQAEMEQRAADRMQELQLKAMDIRATAAERFAAQKEIAKMQLEGRKDIVRLAATLRPHAAPHYPPTQMTDQGLLERQPDGTWKQIKVGDAVAGKPFAPTNALKNLPVKAQTEWSALQNLDSATKAYEALLKDYDPQGRDVLNVEKRNAVKAAFTDLQMRQKEAFGLGAITGPDMQILEGAYTDPTGIAGMFKGGLTGTKAFTAQIDQGRAALNRTKRNFEQQYKVELPDPAGTATAPMPGAGSGGFKILGVRDK